MTSVDVHDLETTMGVRFAAPRLLLEALTHRSYLNENAEWEIPANERLEFLGDAIIDYLAAEYIFARFPEMQEGEMTALRAALVKTEGLAEFARRWRLGEYLLLGKGEEASGGRERLPNLCAAFEALMGALYLDQGIEVVRRVLTPLIAAQTDALIGEKPAEVADTGLPLKDAKSRLQELAQSRYHITPTYRTVAQRGPDHDKEFTVEVMIGHVPWGQGVGRSKQLAEQAAAQAALAKLEREVGSGQ